MITAKDTPILKKLSICFIFSLLKGKLTWGLEPLIVNWDIGLCQLWVYIDFIQTLILDINQKVISEAKDMV